MNRQLLATATAYALSVASLVCAITWWATGNSTWAWPAATAWAGWMLAIAWLRSQPLPHERSSRDRR